MAELPKTSGQRRVDYGIEKARGKIISPLLSFLDLYNRVNNDILCFCSSQ